MNLHVQKRYVLSVFLCGTPTRKQTSEEGWSVSGLFGSWSQEGMEGRAAFGGIVIKQVSTVGDWSLIVPGNVGSQWRTPSYMTECSHPGLLGIHTPAPAGLWVRAASQGIHPLALELGIESLARERGLKLALGRWRQAMCAGHWHHWLHKGPGSSEWEEIDIKRLCTCMYTHSEKNQHQTPKYQNTKHQTPKYPRPTLGALRTVTDRKAYLSALKTVTRFILIPAWRLGSCFCSLI